MKIKTMIFQQFLCLRNFFSLIILFSISAFAGSATAPNFTFFGDATTGIFSPVSGAIGFSSVATETMRITSSGAVGIGITSPSEKLSVSGFIQSTSGGFKFPDGSIQTISATGNLSWTTITGATTAAVGGRYFVDTTSSAFTLTLPASPAVADTIEIIDVAGTFSTNNLTVGRNGLKIMGLNEDMTVSTNNVSFILVYSGATYGWRIK